MSKKIRVWLAMTASVAVIASALLVPQATTAKSGPIGNKILARALRFEQGRASPAKYQMPLSAGVVYTLLQASGELDRRADASGNRALLPSTSGTQGCKNTFVSGTIRNTRVNQDCSRRRQAEEVIAVNPTNPSNLIAGQNDSRIGFNHCGYDWSFDGGRTWGDQVPPFWQFLLGDSRTTDACSDPTVTFDANGNAYVAGIIFSVAAAPNAIVVAKSNAGIGGAFYHTPAALSFQEFRNVPLGVVASDVDPNIFNDKEFIVADANGGSPKVNNVYATWTRFNLATGAGVGGNSPIFFSQSIDGGATWSAGIEISGSSAAFCTDFSGSADPNACDQDQGSHPIVGPDGTIYVVYGNGNTPDFGENQVLFVSCPAAADCSSAASWTAPVKINDLIGLHPIAFAGNVAGCPVGRQCLPPNGYRVPEFTSMSISIDVTGTLYAVWADFRNGFVPPCDTLDFATSAPPCDNDVFYSFSTDGGATWSDAFQLTPAGSAQWQPWSAVTSDGKKLFVAYYDRQYGGCEFSGCNDITLARVTNAASGSPGVTFSRLTTSSMPNLTTVTNPIQAGFLGDYMWVATSGQKVHVVWADTRGLNGTVEEDIYFITSS